MVLDWIGFAAGMVVLVVTWASVIGTLVVPRHVDSRISRGTEWSLDRLFRLAIRKVHSYEVRDRALAWQAPLGLLVRLTVWMGLLALAFGLLMLPSHPHSPGDAFASSSSSMFTLGYAAPHGFGGSLLEALAAFTGLIVVGLQVGYLPVFYAAFNRRETEVSLLVARSGVPAWGPELLIRTKWGIYDGDTRPILDELFTTWERWASEVAESHTTYFALTRFRSSHAWAHWLTSLIAVMDAAAVHLSVAPSLEPKLSARLCLRMGFETLGQIGRTARLPLPTEPDPDAPISVSFEEFAAAVTDLRQVGYPIERTVEEAWPHFRGWRANYDRSALALAYLLDAPPTLWTGPRRWPSQPTPPKRPAARQPQPAAEPPTPDDN
ncbi:MAG: hypothetical protein NVSMB48_20540 [Marmoricola sp.]